MNNKTIMQAFVKGETKGKASNVFIVGNAIYSYGYHFPLAVRKPGLFTGVVYYVNSDKYSHSTTRHQFHLTNALAGIPYQLKNTQELKDLI